MLRSLGVDGVLLKVVLASFGSLGDSHFAVIAMLHRTRQSARESPATSLPWQLAARDRILATSTSATTGKNRRWTSIDVHGK